MEHVKAAAETQKKLDGNAEESMDQEAEKQVVSSAAVAKAIEDMEQSERKKEQDRDCLLCPPEGTDAHTFGIQEGRMANRQAEQWKAP